MSAASVGFFGDGVHVIAWLSNLLTVAAIQCAWLTIVGSFSFSLMLNTLPTLSAKLNLLLNDNHLHTHTLTLSFVSIS